MPAWAVTALILWGVASPPAALLIGASLKAAEERERSRNSSAPRNLRRWT